MEYVFETPGPVHLRVTIGAGDIQVETSARDTTEVAILALNRAAEEAVAQMTVRSDERGGRSEIVIEEPKRGFVSALFNSAQIGVRVRCPYETEVEFQTGSADARVEGPVAAAHTKTGSGDMFFGAVEGELVANSASGDVRADDVAGDCTVKTASGDVRLLSVGGDFVGNLVSGDLNLGEASGSVNVSSVSGDQHIGAISTGEIRLQAVSGDVRVGVRPGLRLWIDATSVSGDMSSELDPAEGPSSGDEDGPLVQLRAKTVSGDVQIVRA
jgi:DUF4097 and DUF4098 domain-containing protein YvlB